MDMKRNLDNNNKKIAKNTLFLYVRMFLIMIVTFYTSRVILRELGVEDFGIYNIVSGVVTMFTTISSSLSSASNRFIQYSLGRDDIEEQRNVFNTTLIVHILIAIVVVVLLETLGLYVLYNKLVIPSTRFYAAFWVFQLSMMALMLSFINLPYSSVIIAHEKMDFYAYVSIFDILLRLGIVYLLVYTTWDKLIFYSFLLVVVPLLIQIIYFVYCRWNYAETSLKWVWKPKLQKKMFVFSIWIFVGSISESLYTQGTNVLLNMFYGPVINAATGIALQLRNAVQKYSDNFQTAFRPQITKNYAIGNMERIAFLVNAGTKYSYGLMYIIILPLCLCTPFFLKLWLGEVPDYTAGFVQLFLIICLVRTLTSPIMIAIQASGDIRKVQLSELLCLMVLPIAYYVLKYYNFSPYYIYVISIFVELLLAFIRVKIVLPIINLSFVVYFKKALMPIVVFTIFSLFVCFFIKEYTDEVEIFKRLIYSSIVNFIFFFLFVINKREKNLLYSSFKQKLRK